MLNINTTEEFEKLLENNKDRIIVILFAAKWAEQCQQVHDALNDLENLLGTEKLQFVEISAEDLPKISMKYKVGAVPTVIFVSKDQSIGRVDGVDVAAITEKCKRFAEQSGTSASDKEPPSLEQRLKSLINRSELMVFMKGERNAPRCGFSKQIIAILNETGLPYETFDILTDEEVRQGLKEYSDWPTYPQVYVKGELVGGLDIIKELKTNNELEKTLKGE